MLSPASNSTNGKMKQQIKDIIIRMDLYPRFEVNPRKVEEYAENIEKLPPVLTNQNNILIDGLHRLKAHRQVGLKEIEVIVEKTASENDLYLRAIETNAKHGLQLSYKDKKSIAVTLYDSKNREQIIKSLSISGSCFDKWTQNKRQQMEEELKEKINNLYLKCKTQQEISKEVNLSEARISQILKKFLNNNKFTEIKDFKPFLFNIWNPPKDNQITYFGNNPQSFTENLLYCYTKPFDVVYDPFAGGGPTIDACKKFLRRYYVADRKPIPSREEEIRKQDIKDGLPKDLPGNIKLVFLDPPYWKQAENQYSKDKEDLANMSLNDFYNTLMNFLKQVKKKLAKDGVIALIMSATQWKMENYQRIDHAFEITKQIEQLGFEIEQRIICPYSTEQYNARQVDIAKEKRIYLNLCRDLIIFKLKNNEIKDISDNGKKS